MKTLTDSQLSDHWDQAWEAVEEKRLERVGAALADIRDENGVSGFSFDLAQGSGGAHLDLDLALARLFRSTMYGVRIHEMPDDAVIDWFGMDMVEHDGERLLLPAPNLAVNTGLHTSAQRTFVTTAGATLTPVSGSTIAGIRYGGVDNNVTAVAATTNQFDTTPANRFIKVFDSDPTYSTANKRMTGLFTIANTDTAIVHRRYGLTNDSANAANTLFSMLSGFILDFNGKAYSITVESQTNFTGS